MNPVNRITCLSALAVFLLAGVSAMASVSGQVGPYRVQIFSEPEVIPVGRARLRIEVTDTSGKPVENAEIRSLVQMPSMNMGERETLAQPVPGTPGSYMVDASFAMAGNFNASISIRGPLGEARGTMGLETGQDTGTPGQSSPDFSFGSIQTWAVVALLAAIAGFVLYRMRQTGQFAAGRPSISRGTVGGILLILVALGASRWAVNRWRRPGSMTPIEAQSMEMNTPAPPGVTLVTLADVSQGSIESRVWYPGQAIAFNEQDVIVRTEGWLSSMPFYIGDRVKADEVVAILDISELRAIAELDRMKAELRSTNHALQGADSEVAAAHEERTGAEADLAAKQTMIADAEAMLMAARADREFWDQQNVRNKTLLDKGALSAEEYQRDAAMAANAAAKVQQAQSRVEQVRAEVRAAQAMLRRADALVTAAEKRRQQMTEGVAAAEASVRSAEASAGIENPHAAHAAADTDTSKVPIYAHLSGVVTARTGELGQHVGPGQPILKIVQTDPIRLQANVAEVDLARIKVGYRVAVRGRNSDEPPVIAKVTSIAPSVDPVTRTGIVEAVVPNRDLRFLPGQSLALDISTGSIEEAVRVPVGAILVKAETGAGTLASGTQNFVWVVEAAAGRGQYLVAPADVRTGASDGVYVQILSGLEPGQKVVVSGTEYLKRGDTVSAATAAEVAP